MELIMENLDVERYKKAQKQVKSIKSFYGHLLYSIIAIGICIYINLKFTPQYLWFFWAMLGTAIGLFFHALEAFKFFSFLNKDWEQKKIKEYMDEEKNNTTKYQ